MEGPNFSVDDLLDLPNAGDKIADNLFSTNSPAAAKSPISSAGAYNNSLPADNQLSGGLSVPDDDLRELEWLSNFEEEPFPSSDDVDLHLIDGPVTRPELELELGLAVPVSATPSEPRKKSTRKRAKGPKPGKEVGRRCSHCSVEKTPQWRTGPEGPKTLCNACGVRYKSGRLMPEYRPASSPTLDPARHSNSHRKVLELRRKKESETVPGVQ